MCQSKWIFQSECGSAEEMQLQSSPLLNPVFSVVTVRKVCHHLDILLLSGKEHTAIDYMQVKIHKTNSVTIIIYN